MWIVGIDTPFYPFINRHDEYEDAKKEYDERVKDALDNNWDEYAMDCIYLAEVKESIANKDFKYVKDQWGY